MHRRHLTASALLASALVLTACGSDTAAGTGDGGAGTAVEAAQGNAADVAFLTGMTPHHEQAVEMSEMVLAANPPAAVAAIAQQIKSAQGPEIEQLTAKLDDLGEDPDAGGGHGGGHGAGSGGTGHGGMMSEAMMAELGAATGADAARLYLEGMIAHHQGAIEASDVEIADGQYAPAIAIAKKIKAAQSAEITEMRALLKTL